MNQAEDHLTDRITGLKNFEAFVDVFPAFVSTAASTGKPFALSYVRLDKLTDYMKPFVAGLKGRDKRNVEEEAIGELIYNARPIIERHTIPVCNYVFRMNPGGVINDLISIIGVGRRVNEAAAIADSIRHEISYTKIGRNKEIFTVSIGVTGFDSALEARPAMSLTAEADYYLARAKGIGNCVFWRGYDLNHEQNLL